MKRFYQLLFFVFFSLVLSGNMQGQDYRAEIEAFQHELDKEYKNPESSPLSKKALKKFKGHKYFPIDSAFRVVATFSRIANPATIEMETSSEKTKTYDKYAKAEFQLQGQSFTLYIYQSHKLRQTEAHKNHLLLPFTDLTSGKESYGGGRYIDLNIPDGDTIVIDFNKAYSPYCAFSNQYSCPIPPPENKLSIKVSAGVKHSK